MAEIVSFKNEFTSLLQEAFGEIEDDLMEAIGLDSRTIKHGPKPDENTKFSVAPPSQRLPRKFKKEMKKAFGEKGFLLWKKNKGLIKVPRRFTNMLRKKMQEDFKAANDRMQLMTLPAIATAPVVTDLNLLLGTHLNSNE